MKLLKYMVLAFIVAIMIGTSNSCVYANDTIDTQVSDATAALDNNSTADDGSVEGELKKIADILVTAGFLISAIKLVQIGFKFMMAPANKRSDAKAALAPWIVGVCVCGLWLVIGKYIMEMLSGVGADNVFE